MLNGGDDLDVAVAGNLGIADLVMEACVRQGKDGVNIESVPVIKLLSSVRSPIVGSSDYEYLRIDVIGNSGEQTAGVDVFDSAGTVLDQRRRR